MDETKNVKYFKRTDANTIMVSESPHFYTNSDFSFNTIKSHTPNQNIDTINSQLFFSNKNSHSRSFSQQNSNINQQINNIIEITEME